MNSHSLEYSVVVPYLLYPDIVESFDEGFCGGILVADGDYAGDVLKATMVVNTNLLNREELCHIGLGGGQSNSMSSGNKMFFKTNNFCSIYMGHFRLFAN